ncbi:MAG: hypothetical protein IJS40_06220 [Synergistaceae bacterium]|nr:hypothetical protein [Synergistaceae bacterium]
MPENNLPQQPQPQYIYVQQPRYNQEEEMEIDLFELFGAIWKKKWRIIFLGILGTALGLAYALYLPFIYKAESRIMPQGGSGGGGRLAGLVQQYGGLASMMGISMPEGAGGTGAVMVDILKSDTVVDTIMDRFNLMEENEWEYRKTAREAMLKNFDAKFDEKGSGIITVSWKDEDPQRAADITNAFVEELQKKMLEMSLSASKQKREFYEAQLIEVQQELANAEEAMMKYQQTSGVIVLEEQAKKLIDAIAALKTQIAAKNVEISSMKSYIRADNPRLKLAQSQLAAMQRELKNLEEEQRRAGGNRTSSGDIMLSVGEIPELGVEYQRYMRALKVAGAKYDFMFGQYESARLGEISDLSMITVIDPAIPPDYKSEPSRAKITIMGGFLGGFLPSAWYAGKFVINEGKKQRRKRKDYDDDYDDEDD